MSWHNPAGRPGKAGPVLVWCRPGPELPSCILCLASRPPALPRLPVARPVLPGSRAGGLLARPAGQDPTPGVAVWLWPAVLPTATLLGKHP